MKWSLARITVKAEVNKYWSIKIKFLQWYFCGWNKGKVPIVLFSFFYFLLLLSKISITGMLLKDSCEVCCFQENVCWRSGHEHDRKKPHRLFHTIRRGLKLSGRHYGSLSDLQMYRPVPVPDLVSCWPVKPTL